jgi:hypothetical protein
MVTGVVLAITWIALIWWLESRPYDDLVTWKAIDALHGNGIMTIRRVAADLDGPVAIPPGVHEPDIRIGGFLLKVVSQPLTVPKVQADGIREAMTLALRKPRTDEKGCIPDPGFVIFIDGTDADGKSFRMLSASFCFRCDVMDVVVGNSSVERNIDDNPGLKTLVLAASNSTDH